MGRGQDWSEFRGRWARVRRLEGMLMSLQEKKVLEKPFF